MERSSRSTVQRNPKRGIYDSEQIYQILDREFICHVGIIQNGTPVVIPTMYGREEDKIYIHGASVSRLVTALEEGIEVCLSVANATGLVLARSAFHHSLNYESVVIFGKGKLVNDSEKETALKVISDHILKGRWEEVRSPSQKELKATKVIEIKIDEASAKVRTGPPKDDPEDYDLNIWAGVLPIQKNYGYPIPDPDLKKKVEISSSVHKKVNPF